MKDLADDYKAALDAAAAELAARHAELSLEHSAHLDAMAEATKAAIDATARKGRDALAQFEAVSQAAYGAMIAKTYQRTREFLGGKSPEPTPPGDDQRQAADDELKAKARQAAEVAEGEEVGDHAIDPPEPPAEAP